LTTKTSLGTQTLLLKALSAKLFISKDTLSEPYVVLASPSLIVLDMSDALLELLGVQADECIGRSILQWVHTTERKDFFHLLPLICRNKEKKILPKFHWKRKDTSSTLLAHEAQMVALSQSQSVILLKLTEEQPYAQIQLHLKDNDFVLCRTSDSTV